MELQHRCRKICPGGAEIGEASVEEGWRKAVEEVSHLNIFCSATHAYLGQFATAKLPPQHVGSTVTTASRN